MKRRTKLEDYPIRLVEQLGKVTDEILGNQFGLTKVSIYGIRKKYGIPSYYYSIGSKKRINEYPENLINQLGKKSDNDLSNEFSRYSKCSIRRLRKRLGISSYISTKRKVYDCPICNKQFSRLESAKNRKGRSGTLYCSKQCFDLWQKRNRIIVKCDNCSKDMMLRTTERIDYKHHFCSRECLYKWNIGKNHSRWAHESILCSYCNKEYQLVRYKIEKHERHFCSFDCEQKWMKENWQGKGHPMWIDGYVPFYGYEWEGLTKEVRNRDKVCMSCKKLDSRLNVHHIIPYRISKDNSLDNLILLCDSCHTNLDYMYRKIESRPQYWENINSMKLEVK